MRRTKGFTLVELLVVIAIIALLMGILMPALARVRSIAFRMVCGTNLSGIGKAMLIYANDYDDELPRAGYPNSLIIDKLDNWYAATRVGAFGADPGQATVTSSFYLLVKYSDVTPKSFLCKSDSYAEEFAISDHIPPATDETELIDVWDFGSTTNFDTDLGADAHCSYSYHHPFSMYALTTSSEPGMAVAADRNPWIPPNARPESDWNTYMAGVLSNPRDTEKQKRGNAIPHQDDGQNVLFLDGHTSFEKFPYCGMEEDNIYTRINPQGAPIGDRAYGDPASRKDSFLINNRAELAGSP